ncbi:MAG: TonB-dependent receptor [Bacteroidetes bacterium]|nr:MAG: TonB-dependent receptor [Bacteroidota bacterium]
MNRRFLFFCLICCASLPGLFAQNYTVSGYVRELSSGEALIGASVVSQDRRGAYTNSYGFFSLTLPAGSQRLIISYIGFAPDTQVLTLSQNMSLDIRLEEAVSSVEEVVITASQDAYAREVKSTQMSQINLKVRDIRLIPSLGGEADIMKVLQLLPGVTKGGEGTTSILVRGGDPDQNLILLDEAVVYNVSHLFGFFSVFNADALKDVNLLKGGFPAQYGGRLSSVIDITMNEGNQEKFHVKGGIGLLSSRLTVEGPIIKNKASFIVSGRRTYIDQVMRVLGLTVPYYFYDLNAKANYSINEKNRVYLSAYLGDDVLYTPRSLQDGDSLGLGQVDFGFRLGNQTATLRWNHLFNARLFSNTSLIYTRFKYDINGSVGANKIFIGSDVQDIGIKNDITYYHNPDNTLRVGAQITNHRFRPNIISAQGDIGQIVKDREVDPILAQELAIYGQHDWQALKRLRINYGLRISGAVTPGKFYPGLEPRLSAVWLLNEKNSFKAGYSRMAQYMHLVSSSTVALPTDLWYPVTRNIRPQGAHQVAGSYTHHFEKPGLLFTLESYYKWMKNLTEYREGANLILNDNFEQELLQGRGHAYGLEFLLKRDEGRINGWIGYTLSFARRQFDELNGGEAFWAKFDRRNDLSVVSIVKVTKRISISSVFSYLSGARFTPQIGQYIVPNPSLSGVEIIPIYSKRNAVRLTAARRFDINIALASKPGRRFKSEWQFGCYNLFNWPTPIRVNINYAPERGLYYTQPSFLGRVLSVAWNFEI